MPAVSVLHSPRDEALGEKIADALTRQGHQTRCLGEDPLAGDLMLEDGAAIVIWSNATAKLARLHIQAREALERGALIPVTVGGARAPSGFEKLQPVDLSGWGGDENDPRWRFVLEEVTLAAQRIGLQDGSVWAEPQSEPPTDTEPAEGNTPEGETIEYEIDEAPAIDEGERVDWDIDPPVPDEAEAAPINVEASYHISAEHYWPETPPLSKKPVRFRARQVVLGGGFALFALTAAAVVFGPALLSPPASIDIASTESEPPSIAFVQPAQPVENANAPVAPKAQSDFEVTSYRDEGNAEEDASASQIAVLDEAGADPADELQNAGEPAGEDVVEVASADEMLAEGDTDNAASAAFDPMEALVAEATREAPVLASLPEEVTARIQLGNYFSDCDTCPDMAALPAGSFRMGSPASEQTRTEAEGPVTDISLARPFAISTREVTFDQWQACVDEGGCRGYAPYDMGWGRGNRPVTNVSFEDATAYAAWLSAKTGNEYRLPSEAEWEFAARAGGVTAFSFGAGISSDKANYNGNYAYLGEKGEFRGRTTPVASFAPNNFGLYDMHGNVWEWTADCWTPGHTGAPANGAPVKNASCTARVIKGGAWNTGGWRLRAAHRLDKANGARENDIGFRIARNLN